MQKYFLKCVFEFLVDFSWFFDDLNTFCMIFMKKLSKDPGFSEFSEICPTLRSSISELSEYFFKIRKDPERSMHKL